MLGRFTLLYEHVNIINEGYSQMTAKKNTGRKKSAATIAKEEQAKQTAEAAKLAEQESANKDESTKDSEVETAPKSETPPTGDEGDAPAAGDNELIPAPAEGEEGEEDMPEIEEEGEFSVEGLSLPAKLTIQTLEEYVAKMGKGVMVSESNGINNQMGLYRAVTNLLTLEGEEFTEVMTRVLSIIHAHRDGAFNDKRLFRFFNNLKLAKDRAKSFERLLSLFTTVCDPTTRSMTLEQVNVEEAVSGVKDGQKQQQLLAYFTK